MSKLHLYKNRLAAVVTTILGSLYITAGADAATGSTAITQQVLPGLLTLASTPTGTMSVATLSNSTQTTTGSLGLLSVVDARGSGAGWSLTATSTGFSHVNTPVHSVGTGGGLVVTGNYTSNTAGTYTVTIASGGALGTATYMVSGLETQAATTTGVSVPLGTRGLTATFAAGTYATGDQFTVAVDTIPASNLTVTPSAITAVSGSSTGVTAGSAYTYSTGSDPATIMTASTTNGLGSYNDTPSLSLNVPTGTKAGTYVATITETLN